ncbi:acyltransferase, partial [Escherichia coli]|nr:acyltransferase [Escherichia coli]
MPSYLASPLFLLGTKNVIIKKKVRIFPGARIETHNGGQILIEENVGIAQNFHINSSVGLVKIGRDTTIAANTFI